MKENLVPVKKILNMINSCKSEEQIKDCKLVVSSYIKTARRNGLVNISELTERLDEELMQRQEALLLVKIFNS